MPALDWAKKHANVLFFVGGFLFDSLTMTRIDSFTDLFIQFFYLSAITLLMILQARAAQGQWTPAGTVAKYWKYDTEVLHFCYGGLLSGFVVFYFKSTSASRSFVFLLLIAFLMIANEMPQVRRFGERLRLGLYAFCVVSYLNYLLPVLVGRMGWLMFLAGWSLSIWVSYLVLKEIARHTENPPLALRNLCKGPAFILVLILVLYALKLIPPVPLSMQHLGIYRGVSREGDKFRLVERQPPWYAPWRSDDHVFMARAGDEIYVFTSVFAPRRFTHQIYIRWNLMDTAKHEWVTADRFPMPLTGGRAEGFRGFMKKVNYEPGVWRIDIETEDARVLGSETFRVEEDLKPGERKMRVRWM